MRIGMVGLDTTHVAAFANILHSTDHPYHVSGARIVAAFPGGSPDFELSISRVEYFTTELREKYGVQMVDSIEQLKGQCDAIFLESIDGRIHLEQFRQVADWGLPIFIDKPFAIASEDAQEMAGIAARMEVRVMSASAMRYAEAFQAALVDAGKGEVTGGDFFGPMQLQEKCPGYFWYGIHSAEMLYAAFGPGCREVQAVREETHDMVIGRWADGRLGTIRGNRTGNNGFGGVIHRQKGSSFFEISSAAKPYYASLLEEIVGFTQQVTEGVPLAETVEIIRFLEAANESLHTRTAIQL